MDISKLSADNERVVEILHPHTGEPIGLRVMLVSLKGNDERIKRARRRYQDRMTYWRSRNKEMPASEVEQYDNEIAAAAVVDWDWYGADYKGEKLPYSHANVLKIFGELAWLKEQVVTEAGNLESFINA